MTLQARADETPRDGECRIDTSVGPDGATVMACELGGQVLAWLPDGVTDRLWVSPTSACAVGSIIRGGIPVVFPQFGTLGPLPRHGLVRTRLWQLGETAPGELTARWAPDETVRQNWPHRVELTVVARAEGYALETSLAVRNGGSDVLEFTGALHTYLRVSDVRQVSLEGLGGHLSVDAHAGGVEAIVPDGPLTTVGARELMVYDVRSPVVLDDPVLGPLVLSAEGWPDRVVWNPGPAHTLVDVPVGEQWNFLCLEVAALRPVQVPPGETWVGRQRLLAG